MASDIWHATGAIMGGVLVQCGAILICVVMLRGGVFSKGTAWLGIVMHGLDLGTHSYRSSSLPTAGVVLMAIAGPLYLVWLFSGRQQAAQNGQTAQSNFGIHADFLTESKGSVFLMKTPLCSVFSVCTNSETAIARQSAYSGCALVHRADPEALHLNRKRALDLAQIAALGWAGKG